MAELLTNSTCVGFPKQARPFVPFSPSMRSLAAGVEQILLGFCSASLLHAATTDASCSSEAERRRAFFYHLLDHAFCSKAVYG